MSNCKWPEDGTYCTNKPQLLSKYCFAHEHESMKNKLMVAIKGLESISKMGKGSGGQVMLTAEHFRSAAKELIKEIRNSQ